MKEFAQVFPLGRQIILTGLSVKEGLTRAFGANGYEITNEQFALLIPLWKENGQSQIALCEKTCKSKSNVTRILDTMEKKNLIIRCGDQTDRRKFLVMLTPYAKQLEQPLTTIALAYGKTVMQGVSKEEMEVLYMLLCRINSNISE